MARSRDWRAGILAATFATLTVFAGPDWTDPPASARTHTTATITATAPAPDPLVDIPPPDQTYEPGNCASMFGLAMQAGWTWNEWPQLGGIIMPRESGCKPDALNDNRSSDRCRKRKRCDWSFGLAQINTYGTLWTRPIGYGTRKTLPELCGLTSRDDLYDPYTNLRCARLLFELRGWDPWQ